MKLKAVALAFLVLAVSVSTYSETPQVKLEDVLKKVEQFKLFNHCAPMMLLIQTEDDEAAPTEISIRNAVESRLRSARLYDENNMDSHLYVTVHVSDHAFLVQINYRKSVIDVATTLHNFASTWDDGAIGTHGGDPGFVLAGLSGLIDKFLVEYLRVNEAACEVRFSPAP